MAPRVWWGRQAETFVCGVRGHVVPASWAQDLGTEWAHLVTVTADGRRLGRCLRCDAWIAAPLDASPADEVPVLTREDVPRRGRALRDAIVLRCIAVERGVHSVAFGLVAIGLFALR